MKDKLCRIRERYTPTVDSKISHTLTVKRPNSTVTLRIFPVTRKAANLTIAFLY